MTNPSDTNTNAIVRRAAEFATLAHQGQFRRDGVTPYIVHPKAVAARVQGDEIAEAIAWLHDVLEDTRFTIDDMERAQIPAEVIRRVVLLTKQSGVEYENYLSAIKKDPVAKKVKLADMLCNLGDNPTEKQMVKYAKGMLALLT